MGADAIGRPQTLRGLLRMFMLVHGAAFDSIRR